MPKVIFEEIQCKRLINHVAGDALPFKWTINPYRGCQHASVYCFARPTHEYLGYNAGRDFDGRILVKMNAPEVLRQEMREPRWRGELIAIGTACDPYEPAEKKYRISRQILETLRDFHNPVSLTTKSVLVARDLDVLKELSQVAEVEVNFSISTLDKRLWHAMEPRTPEPIKRLEAMEKLAKAGINTGVLLAPILPSVTDSEENLESVVKAAVDHGASYLATNVLFLKPGTREWFMPFIREAYPHLSADYQKLYRSAYAPKDYTSRVLGLVDELRNRWRLEPRRQAYFPPVGQLALAI